MPLRNVNSRSADRACATKRARNRPPAFVDMDQGIEYVFLRGQVGLRGDEVRIESRDIGAQADVEFRSRRMQHGRCQSSAASMRRAAETNRLEQSGERAPARVLSVVVIAFLLASPSAQAYRNLTRLQARTILD